MKKFLWLTAMLATLTFSFTVVGCSDGDGKTRATAIQLTFNVWANGNISESEGEQWFKFTSNTYYNTQDIHFEAGTMSQVMVSLYQETSDTAKFEGNMYTGNNHVIAPLMTNNTVYYLKITPYSSSPGTYKIGFNKSNTAPTS